MQTARMIQRMAVISRSLGHKKREGNIRKSKSIKGKINKNILFVSSINFFFASCFYFFLFCFYFSILFFLGKTFPRENFTF